MTYSEWLRKAVADLEVAAQTVNTADQPEEWRIRLLDVGCKTIWHAVGDDPEARLWVGYGMDEIDLVRRFLSGDSDE